MRAPAVFRPFGEQRDRGKGTEALEIDEPGFNPVSAEYWQWDLSRCESLPRFQLLEDKDIPGALGCCESSEVWGL